ncbi:MAG: HAMP domain-containing sensor histidine kinase [Pirellulaceae bacterium]
MKIALKMMLVSLSVIATVTLILSWFLLQQQEAVFVSRAEEIAAHFAHHVAGTLTDCPAGEEHKQLSQLNSSPPIAMEYQSRWVWFDQPSEDGGPQIGMRVHSMTTHRIQSFTRRDGNGRLNVYSYIPIETEDQRPGGVEFVQSMDALQRAHDDAMQGVWLLAGTVMVASTLAIGVASLYFLATPLRRLTDRIERIGKGDLSCPLDGHGRDELGELADGINAMCLRLKRSQEEVAEETAAKVSAMQQLRHEDRLRTVGRLASGIAHELGTHLNVIQGRAQLIQRSSKETLQDEQVEKNAEQIITESQRMTAIIRQVLDFARREKPRRTECSLNRIAAQTVDLLTPLAHRANVELHYSEDQDAIAMVDPNQIQQVVTNLLTNAIDACDAEGHVNVAVWRRGDFSCIEVSDDGAGIDGDDLEQVFEPFYTTKDVGEGTGLGLSIASRIVEEHEGRIEVRSQAGGGTTFTVLLPSDQSSGH